MPLSVTFIDKSTIDGNVETGMVLHFPAKNEFSVSTPDGIVDASIISNTNYASVSGSGISSIKFDDQNGVEIDGDNCNYSACITFNEGIDSKLIKVSDQESSNIVFTQSSDGIIMQSADLNEITVTSYGDTKEAETTFSTNRSLVLIRDKTDDTTGIVQILVSSKNNGIFDQVIIETGSNISLLPARTANSSAIINLLFSITVMVMIVFAGIILVVLVRKQRKK